jgi:Ca-activated chloride channel family protein
MSFLHTEYLLGLLLLLPFFYYIFRLKELDINSIFAQEVIEKIVVKKRGFISKKTRLLLLLSALVFMIIALSRPVILKDEKIQKELDGFNLLIALDISKSMNAKDIFPSRLEYAKHLIYKMMEELQEAKIGVLAFSSNSFLVSPFSEDFKSIEFLISNLNPEYISAKGSSLLSALESSKKIYDSINAKEANIVLISDGADGNEIEQSIKYAKANALKVHILNIGTKTGSSIEDKEGVLIKDKEGNIVITKRDDSIAELASQSGGSFLSVASNTNNLSLFVTQIRASSTKEKVTRDIYEGATELFIYPLFVSIVLVFFSFNSLRFFVIVLFVFTCKDANAGIFDFLHVNKANESYEKKEYKQAAQEFSVLDSDEARYNEANALYKNKEYEKALQKYNEIKSFENEKEYQRLHNIGNTLANMQKIDEAIKSYEEALKLKDDADTKYNLELLKKQQEQKQNQNQDKQQDQQDKEDKKQDEQKEQSSREEKNDNKQEGKENQQEEKDKEDKNNEQQSTKQEEKKMSEQEAKKWEEKMTNKEFKTQPFKLDEKQRKDVETTW